jgi:FAD/FMN-containing dehydrogenase
MCKLGGMLANNSSGPHALRYGAVKDNVRQLRTYLTSGVWLDARPYSLDEPAFERALAAIPALRDVFVLVQTHADAIRAKKPTVSKNSCGYNLFGLVDGLVNGQFDLPKLLVGSEGTLGVVSEATLTLVEKPKATLTALLHFRRLEDVGEAVPRLLALEPSALEVMDANTLDLIGRVKHRVPADAAPRCSLSWMPTHSRSISVGAPNGWRTSADRIGFPRSQSWPSIKNGETNSGPRGRRSIQRCIGSIHRRSRSTLSTMSSFQSNGSAN